MIDVHPDDEPVRNAGAGVPDRIALSGLVAARMSHDLASPLGAIANGVELLMLTGSGTSPELALVAESVESANARLRLFRLAFGPASPQPVSRGEVAALLAAVGRGGRTSFEWAATGDHPRAEVRAVLLMLLCLESALPIGGRIRASRDEATWMVEGEGPRLKVEQALWSGLIGQGAPIPDSAALVQFALLPEALEALRRPLSLQVDLDRITARF